MEDLSFHLVHIYWALIWSFTQRSFYFRTWFSGKHGCLSGKDWVLCIALPLTLPWALSQHSFSTQPSDEKSKHHSKPYPSSVEQRVAHYPRLQSSWATGDPILPRWWVFPLAWPSKACREKTNRAVVHSCFQKARKLLLGSGSNQLQLLTFYNSYKPRLSIRRQGWGS